jgi:DnaJ-class molecular chaperone
MFGISLQELLAFAGIVFILSITGLLQPMLNAMREFRGQPPLDQPPPPVRRSDLDVSYRLLGIPPSATMEEVERAYRQKAKRHHPDLGGDDDAMRALNEAYNQIKRARRR